VRSPLRRRLPLPRVSPSSRARAAARKACASGDVLACDASEAAAVGAAVPLCCPASCRAAPLACWGRESNGDSSSAVSNEGVAASGAERASGGRQLGGSACKTTAPGAPATAKLTRRVRLLGDRFGVLSLRRDALEAAATVTLGALRAVTGGGVSAGAAQGAPAHSAARVTGAPPAPWLKHKHVLGGGAGAAGASPAAERGQPAGSSGPGLLRQRLRAPRHARAGQRAALARPGAGHGHQPRARGGVARASERRTGVPGFIAWKAFRADASNATVLRRRPATLRGMSSASSSVSAMRARPQSGRRRANG
jgi:hypothetical protein